MNKVLVTFAASLTLLGCSQGSLTVLSQPEGAYITVGGNAFGTAPVGKKLIDNGKWVKDSSGCYSVPEIKARWASGAEAVERTRLCGGLRNHYEIVLQRPANAPGLNQDLAIANQQASARAQQQQAQAQRDMAAIQMINAMNQQQYMQQQQQYQRQQQIRANQPYYTNCQQYGNSVNCTTSQ